MEPSDLYNKSKRNLVVFAALLLLVVVGGVEPQDQAQLLGFRIKSPDLVPVALLLVTAYCVYQFCFAWLLQPEESRRRLRYDFPIIVGMAAVFVAIYVILDAIPRLSELGLGYTVYGGVVALAFSVAYVTWRSMQISKWRREVLALRRRSLESRVLDQHWTLEFDPKRKRTKAIEFRQGGEVGEGCNDNEHSWSLEGRTLVISRANDELQNRFEYDEKSDRFVSTDDAEADAVRRGFRGQSIFGSGPPD